jgi:hypothetical protein
MICKSSVIYPYYCDTETAHHEAALPSLNNHILNVQYKGKSKAIPVTGREGPIGSLRRHGSHILSTQSAHRWR